MDNASSDFDNACKRIKNKMTAVYVRRELAPPNFSFPASLGAWQRDYCTFVGKSEKGYIVKRADRRGIYEKHMPAVSGNFKRGSVQHFCFKARNRFESQSTGDPGNTRCCTT